MAWQVESKVYVGDISRDMTERDLERAFSDYGSIRSVWVATDPPGFAFVQFDDERDALDAVKGLDGTRISGEKVRVEMSTGKVRPKPWDRDRGGRRGGGRAYDPSDKCYACGDRGHYAYDCPRSGRGRSPRRDSYRGRRSYSRDRRSYSRDRRDRSSSRDRGYHKRSRSPRRSYSRDRY